MCKLIKYILLHVHLTMEKKTIFDIFCCCFFGEGKRAMQAHKKICDIYSKDALLERMCQKWFALMISTFNVHRVRKNQ